MTSPARLNDSSKFTNSPPPVPSRPPAYKPPPPPVTVTVESPITTDAQPQSVPNYKPKPPPRYAPPPPPQLTQIVDRAGSPKTVIDRTSPKTIVERTTSPTPENVAEKENNKKKMVISEMIETEKKYVADIAFIIDRYVTPLLQMGILDKDEIRGIFSNIVEIKTVNVQILEGFELGVDSVASILSRLVPYLKIYIPYCTNYQKSITELDKAADSNKKFKEFIQDESIIAEKGGLHIKDLLIKPIQRITKYPLLINEMLRCTSENDPEHKILTTLLSQIVEVTKFVNNESSHRDKLQKVIETSQKLTNTPENWILVEPSRYYLREGKLKIWRNGKKSKEYVFLFSESNGSNYMFKRYFSIDSAIRIPEDQVVESDCQFIFIDEVNETTFILQSESKDLRDMWLEDIRRLHGENVKKEARLTEVEEKYKRLNLTGGTGGSSVLSGISTNTLEQLHTMMGGSAPPDKTNRNSHVVNRPRTTTTNTPSRKTIGEAKYEKNPKLGTMTLGRIKKDTSEKPSMMGFNFRTSNSDVPKEEEKEKRGRSSTTTPTKELAAKFGTLRGEKPPLVASDKDLIKELKKQKMYNKP